MQERENKDNKIENLKQVSYLESRDKIANNRAEAAISIQSGGFSKRISRRSHPTAKAVGFPTFVVNFLI